MSELESLRDHCRKQAAASERTAQALRREAATVDHNTGPEVRAWLTKAERDLALWNQIANEITQHLATPAPTATELDEPLWETP